MGNFEEVKTKKKLRVFRNREDEYLFILQSCSDGYYHVISDEPGPDVQTFVLQAFEIMDAYGIAL